MNYENEVWKPVPGYEGHYEASSAGRIRKAKSNNIVVPRLFNNRFVVLLYDGVKRQNKGCVLGRIVWKAFVDDGIMPSTLVMHRDGDVTNCSIDNLYVMSRSERCKQVNQGTPHALLINGVWYVACGTKKVTCKSRREASYRAYEIITGRSSFSDFITENRKRGHNTMNQVKVKHYSINRVDGMYRLRVRVAPGKWKGCGYYDSRRLAAAAANEILATGVISAASKKRKTASKYAGVTMSKSTGRIYWIVQYKGKYVASFRCEHIAGFVAKMVRDGVIPPEPIGRNTMKKNKRCGQA